MFPMGLEITNESFLELVLSVQSVGFWIEGICHIWYYAPYGVTPFSFLYLCSSPQEHRYNFRLARVDVPFTLLFRIRSFYIFRSRLQIALEEKQIVTPWLEGKPVYAHHSLLKAVI